MPQDRDRYLDHLRGIAIVWVVLVHVFYFKEFVPEISIGRLVQVLMLFEMPLLFFVSGASLFLSHQTRPSIGSFLKRRAPRLLAPYALLAVICSSLFYVGELMAGRSLDFGQIVSWLLLLPRPVVPEYAGFYIWFIRVMVGVSLAHIVLVRLFLSDRMRTPTAVALLIGVTAFSFVGKPIPDFYAPPVHQLPQYIVFYGAFAYIGYYYASDRLTCSPRWLALIYTGSYLLLMGVIVRGIVSYDAQINKFPPNVGYALLGVNWLALLLFFRPAVTAVANRGTAIAQGLRFFSAHSYTVYLYHGIAFWITDLVLPFLRISDLLQGAHYTAWIGTYFVFALMATAVVTMLVDRVTNLSTDAIRVLLIKAWFPLKQNQAMINPELGLVE